MTSELNLDALEAAEKSATPAPWYQTGSPWFPDGNGVVAGSPDGNIAPYLADFNPMGIRDDYQDAKADYGRPFEVVDADADAAFVAAIRNATPALIAAARERDTLAARVVELERDAVTRKTREMTHAPGCHLWGRAHYECLLAKFNEDNKS